MSESASQSRPSPPPPPSPAPGVGRRGNSWFINSQTRPIHASEEDETSCQVSESPEPPQRAEHSHHPSANACTGNPFAAYCVASEIPFAAYQKSSNTTDLRSAPKMPWQLCGWAARLESCPWFPTMDTSAGLYLTECIYLLVLENQNPHKIVNLSFTITNQNVKLKVL